MADSSIIIPVGSAYAVAGITWTPLGNDPRQELKTNSKLSGSKHGVLIATPSGRHLLGLVPIRAPSKARSGYSAAAWLANATETPILFLKGLPSGKFWVLCVKPGEIDQRTDDIVHEEEAITLIDFAMSDATHDQDAKALRIVVDGDRCPNSAMLNRVDREQLTFAELVRGYKPGSAERVKKLIGITTGQVVSVAVVAAVLAGSYYAYDLYDQSVRAAALAVAQADLQRQHLTAQQIKSETDLRITRAVIDAVTEDTATPSPDRLIKVCLSTIRGVGDQIAGWRLTQVDCPKTGDSVNLAYQVMEDVSSGATNASLIAMARARFGRLPSIAMGTDRAGLTLPIEAPANRETLTPLQLPKYQEIVEKFGTRFQLLHQDIEAVHVTITPPAARSIQYVDPAHDSPGDKARMAEVPAERGYNKGVIQITGNSLWQLEQFSLAYPFLSIKKIEATPSGNDPDAYTWRLEGEYVSSRS